MHVTDVYLFVFVIWIQVFLKKKKILSAIHVNKKLTAKLWQVKKFIRKMKTHGNLKIDIFTVLLLQSACKSSTWMDCRPLNAQRHTDVVVWHWFLKENLSCLDPGSVFQNTVTQVATGCCRVICQWCKHGGTCSSWLGKETIVLWHVNIILSL